MNLSKTSIYALHGLAYIASRQGTSYVPLSEIAGRQHLPQKHLAKIFQRLVKADILRSSRGVNGGFLLARPANEISLIDIIGSLEPVPSEDDCLIGGEPCGRQEPCNVGRTWHDLQRPFLSGLAETSLADIAEPPN